MRVARRQSWIKNEARKNSSNVNQVPMWIFTRRIPSQHLDFIFCSRLVFDCSHYSLTRVHMPQHASQDRAWKRNHSVRTCTHCCKTQADLIIRARRALLFFPQGTRASLARLLQCARKRRMRFERSSLTWAAGGAASGDRVHTARVLTKKGEARTCTAKSLSARLIPTQLLNFFKNFLFLKPFTHLFRHPVIFEGK